MAQPFPLPCERFVPRWADSVDYEDLSCSECGYAGWAHPSFEEQHPEMWAEAREYERKRVEDIRREHELYKPKLAPKGGS